MNDKEAERVANHIGEIRRRCTLIEKIMAQAPRPKPKVKASYVASQQAQGLVASWHKRMPLDLQDKKKRLAYCQTFDQMHDIDGVSWPEIIKIAKHACTEWGSQFIQSPSKLRRPSREYPEKKTWEVIRDQASAAQANGQDVPETIRRLLDA